MLQQLTLIHRKPLGSVQYTRREEALEGRPQISSPGCTTVISLPDALVRVVSLTLSSFGKSLSPQIPQLGVLGGDA